MYYVITALVFALLGVVAGALIWRKNGGKAEDVYNRIKG